MISPYISRYKSCLLFLCGKCVNISIQKLTAQSVEEVRPGIFVYDMGQNMVGVPEITLKGMYN